MSKEITKMNYKQYYKPKKFEKALFSLENEVDLKTKFESSHIEPLAEFVNSVLYIVRLKTDNTLYIYNYKKGYYEFLSDILLKALFKHLINMVGLSWASHIEGEVLGAVRRSIKRQVKGFNTSNALNLKNGIFDLDTGELYYKTPQDALFTSALDYEYDSDAECPRFIKFITRQPVMMPH